MGLKQEIAERRSEIHSDGYPMSIGELINLYRDGELDIHPEFQRYFRWSDEQKTRLIESILLGIPIPSIFVSQREDGVWDVIDGLQRLSTIFQLVGVLKDEHGSIIEPLVMMKTKYLPSLEGKQWETDDLENELGRDNQLIIRRSKIDVKIILRESSESSKYELFQRLNTGGSQLTAQELRNVILITVNTDAYRWLKALATYPSFQTCIALSDRYMAEQYDVELALRFMVLRAADEKTLRSIGDIGDFLNDAALELAEPKWFRSFRKSEEVAFKTTFDLLDELLGDSAFHRYDEIKARFTGGFSISAYETIAIGLGYHAEKISKQRANFAKIKDNAQQLWSHKTFLDSSGSGVRASSRIPVIIPLGRELFGP